MAIGEVREIPSKKRIQCTTASSEIEEPTYRDRKEAFGREEQPLLETK